MARSAKIPTTWSNIPVGTFLDGYEVLATEEEVTGNFRALLDEDGQHNWTDWVWGARPVSVYV